MKKILILLSAITLPGTFAATAMGCSGDSTYNTFLKYIKNKESFVYFMGARDCPKCQSTKIKVWNYLTANNNANLKYIIDGNGNYSANALYKGPSAGKTAYENLHLYSREINKVSDFFTDSTNKKIIKYVVEQTADAQALLGHKPHGLTYSKIGISGTPLFIFFDQGQYEGFEDLEIKRPTNDGPATEQTDASFMWYTKTHIVDHTWPRFPDSPKS